MVNCEPINSQGSRVISKGEKGVSRFIKTAKNPQSKYQYTPPSFIDTQGNLLYIIYIIHRL